MNINPLNKSMYDPDLPFYVPSGDIWDDFERNKTITDYNSDIKNNDNNNAELHKFNINQSYILSSMFLNDDEEEDGDDVLQTKYLSHKKPPTHRSGSLSPSKISQYKKVILDLIKNPDLAVTLFSLDGPTNTTNTTFSTWRPDDSPNTSRTIEEFKQLYRPRDDAGRTALILIFYSLIICVSLFGNFLVCHVVFRTRTLRTVTNSFLANLAISDLLMTALNIPFNVARILLDEWPFGTLMCYLVPYVQVVSVYVSALTMVAIAIDRYRVIVHPLKPRLTKIQGGVIIGIVWLIAGVAAVPHAMFNEVSLVTTYKRVNRCQASYPQPSLLFRKWLTLGTFISQYALPLTITMAAYVCVSRKVWWRSVLGAATKYQVYLHIKAKRKTVKMLLVVVFVFAVCWLPLNTYHLYVDFDPDTGPKRHSSTVFFICHWFAMSSVCYNPFIYSWLNDHFKAGAKTWLFCFARKIFRMKSTPDLEQNTLNFCKLRDSITVSSSTYGGTTGCTIRSGGSRSDSMRSRSSLSHSQVHSLTASDIHVPLDELMTSPPKQFKNKLSLKTSSSSVSSGSFGTRPMVSSFIAGEGLDEWSVSHFDHKKATSNPGIQEQQKPTLNRGKPNECHSTKFRFTDQEPSKNLIKYSKNSDLKHNDNISDVKSITNLIENKNKMSINHIAVCQEHLHSKILQPHPCCGKNSKIYNISSRKRHKQQFEHDALKRHLDREGANSGSKNSKHVLSRSLSLPSVELVNNSDYNARRVFKMNILLSSLSISSSELSMPISESKTYLDVNKFNNCCN